MTPPETPSPEVPSPEVPSPENPSPENRAPSAAAERLAAFPLVIETPVAWGEMDAMGHVNNIVYFRYFESARIEYFERVGLLAHMREHGVGPILASTSCRFRRPLTHPDRVSIATRAHDLGEDRFTMDYLIVSHTQDAVVAIGEGLIVTYDYRALAKAPLPEAVRDRIERYEGRGG